MDRVGRTGPDAEEPRSIRGRRLHNRLLLALPRHAFDRLQPLLEPLETTRGQEIDRVDGVIDDLYFVDRGLVSMVKTTHDGRSVEVGAIGVEGVTDPIALFGIDRAVLETIVQIPGSAFRIRREALRDATQADDAIQGMMKAYARFALSQIALTAACNRLHSLEQRCCRWLLIAHDSALSDSFQLTHEFLAMMLGVQRASVSITANALKKAGVVTYSHGKMTIVDRRALEEGSCECYATMRAELSRLFAAAP